MPPSQSSTPIRYASRSMIMVVRFSVPWREVTAFMDYYRQWFHSVDHALIDHDDGRSVEVHFGHMGDEYNVIFIYRYHGLDRGAFFDAYETAYGEAHGVSTDIRQHIVAKEVAWLEMATRSDVVHRAPLDVEAFAAAGQAVED